MRNMREGYKITELGEIPVEWDIKLFGDVVEKIVGGGTPSRKIEEYFTGNIPWVTVKDLDGSFYKSDSMEHITREAINNSATNLIEEGKVIISTRMGLGRGFINTVPMTINQDLKAIYSKHYINNRFLMFWFLNCANEIVAMGKGSTVKGITLDELKSLKVKVPPLKEQKKIADILSIVDDQIEQTVSILDKTKELKEGLMQRLLTKGIGHTEFKETEVGVIPKEWEVKSLEELGKTYSGLSGKSKDDFGKGKPYIPYKNIFANSIIDLSYLDFVTILDNENQNKVKYGDIFFTTSSETPDEVGMVSVLIDEIKELYLNSFCFGYRLNNFATLSPHFARFLLRGNRIRKIISKLAQGSTRYNLSKNAVLKIYIPIPPLNEQKQIADILLLVDKKIEQYEIRKEGLRTLKQGLMQKLLTGKIRVKI